jgi:superfamily II DNA or RNA helicase
VNLAHARLVLEAFHKGGHRAAILSKDTKREERRHLLDEFKAGHLRVLISVGVLLEGIDCPAAKVCIWARPTMSLTVYLQGTGRVLRPYKDPVTDLMVTPVIIDHTDNTTRLRHPFYRHEWSLTGPPKKSGDGVVLMKECPNCGLQLTAAARECECGETFGEKAGPPVETAEELVEKTYEEELVDKLRESFVRNWKQAKKQGFAAGYVHVKVLEETRMPPPRAWMKNVEQDYERDLEWKRKHQMRIAMKARRARARKVVAS